MLNQLKKMAEERFDLSEPRNERGFTLIELLVVIIITGILAAIAIPVFLNQREAAWRSEVETDLRNISIAVETYATTNGGSFTGAAEDTNVAATVERHGDGTRKVYTVVPGASGTTYTLTVTHSELGITAGVGWDSGAGGFVGWNGNALNGSTPGGGGDPVGDGEDD